MELQHEARELVHGLLEALLQVGDVLQVALQARLQGVLCRGQQQAHGHLLARAGFGAVAAGQAQQAGARQQHGRQEYSPYDCRHLGCADEQHVPTQPQHISQSNDPSELVQGSLIRD